MSKCTNWYSRETIELTVKENAHYQSDSIQMVVIEHSENISSFEFEMLINKRYLGFLCFFFIDSEYDSAYDQMIRLSPHWLLRNAFTVIAWNTHTYTYMQANFKALLQRLEMNYRNLNT